MNIPKAQNALIGDSGYVGSTLRRQTHFQRGYRSNNISEIAGENFETIVCSAAPAQKWIANREPDTDRRNIENLIAHLKTASCNNFILISTVDVFKNPISVDEDTAVDEEGLHAYGLHRRLLEKFVERHFRQSLIIRLPGLVGPGLRKNIIFDFLHGNNVQAIDSRGIFQFYPMVNLWWDIQTALRADLKLVHLTAEPLGVADVSEQCLGKPFTQPQANNPAMYDLRTRHAAVFGASGNYQYTRRETIQAIRAYVQSEPRAANAQRGAIA